MINKKKITIKGEDILLKRGNPDFFHIIRLRVIKALSGYFPEIGDDPQNPSDNVGIMGVASLYKFSEIVATAGFSKIPEKLDFSDSSVIIRLEAAFHDYLEGDNFDFWETLAKEVALFLNPNGSEGQPGSTLSLSEVNEALKKSD